ncbi:glutathione S-transferase 1 [Culex quinquefasciatus]|uniref:glutathione S-transferase 1 n=1 Tax=Culex quinquefasciatus TaxID=7176 RepID=UPI0018E3865B|nr:glutathione S-transferase 1 [Culex quinquefasciatus]XP_039441830.1 glutathione S-transferase 1-like [Culex pipiens pallens]
MVNPILYTLHLSPPCRAVELTAKALGLHLDQRVVNLMAGDHLKPEYLKMNPRHTVPVLDDNGTIVYESHAIMIYLVSKYGKDDSLYPKDLAKQSKVNAALFFESGVLFARMRTITYPIFLEGCREIPSAKAEDVRKAYQLLEDTLVESYVAGSSLTIGDFSCISTISSAMGFIPIDRTKFPRIHGWINRLKELPYYEEANGGGATQLSTEVLKLLEKRN